MGNQRSSDNFRERPNPSRTFFVTYESSHKWSTGSSNSSSTYDSHQFLLRFRRYEWRINKRFREIIELDQHLYDLFPEKLDLIKVPQKYPKIFRVHDENLLLLRGRDIAIYLQRLVDDEEISGTRVMKEFLRIGETSFDRKLGRKGREGYIQKCSGGYLENYASRTGELLKTWRTRWLVLHDNFIAYYEFSGDLRPLGCLHIDRNFTVTIIGKQVTITNQSRKLLLRATTQQDATEWAQELSTFYQKTPRRLPQPFEAHYPPRPHSNVKLFSSGEDYFLALAIGLLQAKEEILIASWMISPTVLLTRPPYPPLRLDQILKHKADQGVKIFILLYKEVELSGLGNDSARCKSVLESLNPYNIYVIRHPNKFIGGSTALLWSHHEKIVIIDRSRPPLHEITECRSYGFVGGIDPCFGRWDNPDHLLADIDGFVFPGRDYYQPGKNLFQTPKWLSGKLLDSGDEENIFLTSLAEDSNEEMKRHEVSFNFSESDISFPIIKTLVESSTSPKTKVTLKVFQTRQLYPRMPWHDVHCCITGLPSRDLASHFVQRWNHHRASKSEMNKPLLTDVTDDPFFSICARCGQDKICESETICQKCGYHLESLSAESLHVNHQAAEYSPICCFTYEIGFIGNLGCRIQGEGPVAITEITHPEVVALHSPGRMLTSEGDGEKLCNQELRPQVGDVLVEIQNRSVVHLSSSQINRYLKTLQSQKKSDDSNNPISLKLRRFYTGNDPQLLKHDRKVKLIETQILSQSRFCSENEAHEESTENNILTQEEENWDHRTTRLSLISKISLEQEVSRAFTSVFSMKNILPNPDILQGSCSIQVLRSVGPWSIGQSVESSIQNCWVESIEQSNHFIYIENQFFIGDLAGPDLKNPIPRAILNRLLRAVQEKEAFKVIILLPLHPEGDFVSNGGVLTIMNYQSRTISRGSQSLLEQFKMLTKGEVNALDYICFCSLRNWGHVDDQIMIEQIYVHDKLLIVDDRILIVGSANINDRSMLGDRDSEVAVRIEDSNQLPGSMNGIPWNVGTIPHLFRKKLMQQHLGRTDIDLADPICSEVYQDTWLKTAQSNSTIYDSLDGPCSYYRCRTLDEYRLNLSTQSQSQASQSPEEIRGQLQQLSGQLVLWPLGFLESENIPLTHSVAKEVFM